MGQTIQLRWRCSTDSDNDYNTTNGSYIDTGTITTVVTNSNPFDLVNPFLTATNSFAVVVNPSSQDGGGRSPRKEQEETESTEIRFMTGFSSPMNDMNQAFGLPTDNDGMMNPARCAGLV